MTAVLLVLAVAGTSLLARPPVPRARTAPRTPPRAEPAVPPDLVTVVDLLAVAVAAGASVPHALTAVGKALGGTVGADLHRAGGALVLGAPWAAAFAHAPGTAAALDPLAAAWVGGTAAGPALRVAATNLRARRQRAAREAAGRLGVRVVLPLGLCFLPAFVLVGLVPVLVSLAGGLLG